MSVHTEVVRRLPAHTEETDHVEAIGLARLDDKWTVQRGGAQDHALARPDIGISTRRTATNFDTKLDMLFFY
jgi:hypothetical protein